MRYFFVVLVLLVASGWSATALAQEPRTDRVDIFGAFDHMPITYRVHGGQSAAEIVRTGLDAWTRGAHDYAAAHTEAAHLAGFGFRPASGSEVADIDVIFAASEGFIGFGIPFPAFPYSPDGRVLHSVVEVPVRASDLCQPCPPSLTKSDREALTLSDGSYQLLAIHELGHGLGFSHATDGTMVGTIARVGGSAGSHCFTELELGGLALMYAWMADPAGGFVHPPVSYSTVIDEPLYCVNATPAPPAEIPGSGGTMRCWIDPQPHCIPQ